MKDGAGWGEGESTLSEQFSISKEWAFYRHDPSRVTSSKQGLLQSRHEPQDLGIHEEKLRNTFQKGGMDSMLSIQPTETGYHTQPGLNILRQEITWKKS